jgi:hypothetical protein
MTTEQLEAMKAVQDTYQKMQETEEVLDESNLRYGEKNVGKRDPDLFNAEKTAGEDKDPKVAYSNKPKVHPSTLRDVQSAEDEKAGRYYHKVAFSQKDSFKAIGGRWDNDRKSWYLTDKETSDANKSKYFKEDLDEALTGREALAVAAKKKGFGTPEKEALLLKQKAEMEARHAKADADYEARYGKKPSVNEDSDLEEKVLTPTDIEQKEVAVKGMKKKLPELKAKYGDRAQSIMYAIATNIAKKQPD